MTKQPFVIYGRKPVLESIRSRAPLSKIYIQYGCKGDVVEDIRREARKRQIPLTEVTADKFYSLAKGADAQGVIGFRATFRTTEFTGLLESLSTAANPLLIALDSIQDPHNVGAILRTAEAAGVAGVLVTKHQSAPLNETVMKTSAGALELLRVTPVENLAQALDALKKKGFWIAGTALNATQPHYSLDYNIPLVLVFGNEEKGIRPLVMKSCDFLLKIPMAGKINSLNVSVSAGILLFEALRSRAAGPAES